MENYVRIYATNIKIRKYINTHTIYIYIRIYIFGMDYNHF